MLIDDALAEGFDGVEIDLVWYEDDTILSHEHGSKVGRALRDVNFRECIVAVNVKEYGMAPYLQLPTARDWFAFDVPGPELELYRRAGVPVFGRWSQYERHSGTPGILLDDFSRSKDGQVGVWYTAPRHLPIALISNCLEGGEDAPAVVSAATYVIRKTLS